MAQSQARYCARVLLRWGIGLCWLCGVGVAAADVEVRVPVTLPMAVLQRQLDQSLLISPGTAIEVYRQGHCRNLSLSSIRLEQVAGKLQLASHADAQMGAATFGRCFPGESFSGWVHFTLEPYLDEGLRLRYRIADSALVGGHGEQATLANLVWKLSREFLNARLEAFAVDLSSPRTEVLEVLHAFAPAQAVAPVEELLRGVRLGQPELVAAGGVVVPLEFRMPDRYVVATAPTGGVAGRAAEPPLTGEELAKVEGALENWDAFLAFVVKTLGLNASDQDIRDRLLETLLVSRYHLAGILAGEETPARQDPVYALFLEAWASLRVLVQETETRGLVQGRLLPYLAFISAGDALLAMNTAAPGLGLDISADGLRRMARVLSPDINQDPLHFDWDVDPQLRDLLDSPPEPQSQAEPLLWRWLAAAQAAEDAPTDAYYGRLTRWLPAEAEMEEYGGLVGKLLASVAGSEAVGAGFNAEHTAVLANLVPATAMTESCWRQYMNGRNGLTFVRSKAGSVGMMQVNQYVWRGFYDLDKLKWDPAYNVAAGTQILVRYMRKFAFAVATKTGEPAHIPRATYSVYNAGPKAAERFLKAKPGSRAGRVDARFWKLYQGFAAGGLPDLSKCRFVADGDGVDEPDAAPPADGDSS